MGLAEVRLAAQTPGVFNFIANSFRASESESLISDPSQNRSIPGALITVIRTNGTQGKMLVDYIMTTNGTAVAGKDFVATNGTLTFLDYQTSATFIVAIKDNSTTNANKTVNLVLANPRPAPEENQRLAPTLGGVTNATLTIMDNDTGFNLSRSWYHVNETAGSIVIDVVLPEGGQDGFSVDYRVSGGSGYQLMPGSTYARDDQDFTSDSGTLNFPAGSSRETFTLMILDDATIEFNEDIRIQLSNSKATRPVTVTNIVTETNDVGVITTNMTTETNEVDLPMGQVSTAIVTIISDEQSAGAADPEYNPELNSLTQPPFNPTPGANNTVYAVAIQPDEKVVIGGEFTAVNAVTQNRVARLNPDGSLDPDFDIGTGTDGYVSAVAVRKDGKIVIGGGFTSFNGLSRYSLARLNTDGSLDATFNPGTSINGPVRAIAVTELSQRINRTATGDDREDRFVINTGSTSGTIVIDYDFLAVPDFLRVYYQGVKLYDSGVTNGFASVTIPYGPGTSTDVTIVVNEGGGEFGTAWLYSVTISSSGGNKVIIGGDFTSVDGTSRNSIAQLNDNGTLDRSFNPGTGMNGPVYAIVRQSDGKLIVGGDFTYANGIAYNSIARLNGDGSLDTTFNPGAGADGPVYAIAVRQSTDLPVSADSSAGTEGMHTNVVNLGANTGTINLSFIFQPNTNNVTTNTVRIYFDGARIYDTNVVVSMTSPGSGSISVPFGPGQTNSVAIVINEDNDNDSVWSYTGTISTGLTGVGKILIAGSFTSIDLVSRNGLAQLNPDGSLDTAFDPGAGANNAIFALAFDANANVYIGGAFTAVNGTRRTGIARLFPNGKVDTSFMDTAYNQYAGLVSTSTQDPIRFINAIAVQSDGNVLIGGDFRQIGGNYSSNYLANTLFYMGKPYEFVVTRVGVVTRNNYARLLGGATPGPGNVELAVDKYHVDESAGSAYVSVIRTNGSLGAVSIYLSTADGTAKQGEDYAPAVNAEFKWGAGVMSSGLVPVGVLNDVKVEGDETFRMKATLAPTTFFLAGLPILVGTALGRDMAVVTIADDDFTPCAFSFGSPDYRVDENIGLAPITVVRTGGASGRVTVDYTTRDITNVIPALAGSDYLARSGTLTFDPGQTNKTFMVQIVDDTVVEPDESALLVLANPRGTGAQLGALTNAVLTIVDNDYAPGRLGFSITNFFVPENKTNAVINVRRVGGNSGVVSVGFYTSDGTAWAGVHYAATNGTLTWADGDSADKTFTVRLADDNQVAGNTTVYLTLTDFAGALPGNITTALLTIVDDDTYGRLSLNATNYLVGEEEGQLTVFVTRSSGMAGTVSVDYATRDGSAKSGVDYVGVTNTLYLAPGLISTNFTLQILDDAMVSSNKTLTLRLFSPTNATLGLFTNATITIIDKESHATPAGQVDKSYNPKAGANNFVNAIALQTNESLIIGGDFTTVNQVSRNRLARLSADGFLDGLFNLGTGPNGSVRALALQGDGKIIIGGSFTVVHGLNRNYIARLNTDGSLDTFFDPSAGADNPVYAIALQSDGRVLIGGDFANVNGVSRNYIARLNANGALDLTFNPGAGPNGTVYAIAVQRDGRMVIGGSFTAVNNVRQNGYARLHPDGSLDSSINPGTGTDGSVRAVAIQSDGKVVIGGVFTSVNGANVNRLARLNPDGSLDTAFNVGSGANNAVYAIALQLDEKLVVGGDFTQFNGISRTRITRLRQDGSVDPTINFGTGANSFVSAIAIQADRKIVIGGGFTQVNGLPRNYIARLFGGSVAGPGTLEFTTADWRVSETATNATVSVRRTGGTTGAISVDLGTSDGTATAGSDYLATDRTLVFAEGETIGAVSIPIVDDALVEEDETVNLTLANVTGGAALGAQPIATVTIESDDSVVGFSLPSFSVNENIATGNATITVTRASATNGTVTVSYSTAGITATAGQDYQNASGVLIFGPGETNKTFSVPILDDALVEGNEMVQLSLSGPGGGAVLGQATAALTIVDNDVAPGVISFDSSTYRVDESGKYAVITVGRRGGSTGVISVNYASSDGTAQAGQDYLATNGVLAFADGEVSKAFTVQILDDALDEGTETVNLTLSNPTGGATIGTPSSASLSITDNDFGPGSLDVSFDPGQGANNSVQTLLLQADGRILLAGAFTTINGVSYNRLARLNTNGLPDTTFSSQGANGLVWSLRPQAETNLVIGGAFSRVGSLSRSYVGRLSTNGVVDTSFNLPASENNQVYSVAPLANGKVVIGGAFTEPVIGIARLNTDGSLDVSFNPEGGTDGPVYCAVLQPDGKVLLGGQFTLVGGVSRNGIARLNPNGGLDAGFATGTGANGAVYAILLQPDGKVLIAGGFTRIRGVTRNRFARLNADGSLDPGFNPGVGANNTVLALALQPDGKILLGGNFTQVGGIDRVRIARINADGALDLGFTAGRGADGAVNAVVVQTDGRVIIGGQFTTVNGVRRPRIAQLLGGDRQSDSRFNSITRLANGEFYLMLDVQPGGTYTIQASSDLVDWIPLSTNTPAGPTWEFTDTSAPNFNSRFYRAIRTVAP
jgi:uncharacterized delta-60 repeat protein